MRLGSFSKQNTACLGLIHGDRTLNLTELGRSGRRGYEVLAEARDATALWVPAARAVLDKLDQEIRASGMPAEWDQLCEPSQEFDWLPPVAVPEKIICIGLNYRDHAAESKMEIPKEPVIFNKYNNALVGASGPVILPSNSTQVDYEAELAVILGKQAKRVSPEDAVDYVGGYTLMHDVSARDWQFRTGQWVSGKTFDNFAPCGPHLVTPDEIDDPHDLDIRLTLNGRVMQDSNTRNLIFNIPTLISYTSHMFTLKPGDIISTGTPPGVGFARRPQVFLQDGDIVELFVEGVGTMRNRVIAEGKASRAVS
jgi:2-keto-4-pentenoate hydratase/2-oxohepta-3-ene-1,7-dioic acid hydratase in catechol pathway